eukprot:TRINITY_DN8615_c0_g1_i7.p1 TRINITY_DN8615_c0_g1~~TRINITY_DN8615_c0_g1_i7.p1  ORF type:complete len:311 (-),score=40.47 TRINITY_DN8615_c0_g1_i7:631-1563(-)
MCHSTLHCHSLAVFFSEGEAVVGTSLLLENSTLGRVSAEILNVTSASRVVINKRNTSNVINDVAPDCTQGSVALIGDSTLSGGFLNSCIIEVGATVTVTFENIANDALLNLNIDDTSALFRDGILINETGCVIPFEITPTITGSVGQFICAQPAPSCFPFEATVQAQGTASLQKLAQLHPGAHLLAAGRYTAVLGMLHYTTENSAILAVEQSFGELRVSANHLLLVDGGLSMKAKDVSVGQTMQLQDGSLSEVVAIRRDTAMLGVQAPLTASGLIEVDAVTASVYAGIHTPGVRIPHSAMHSAFFFLRAY